MEKQNSIKAVLFDFDGTIIFLPTDYVRVRSRLRELFSQFKVSSDFYPLIESIEHSILELRKRGAPNSIVEQVGENAFKIIQDEELKAVEVATLAEGAKETLSSMRENNIAIAVVSRNGKNCIESCFSKFNLPDPDLVVAREDSTEIKPHPEHFRIALKGLGVKSSEVVVVGDSYHDIRGAKNLGILSILIIKKNGEKIEKPPQPDYQVLSLNEIGNIIGLEYPKEKQHV